MIPNGVVDPIPGHILIVDDQESNRDLLSRRLAKHGYTFESASSGEEACVLLDRSQFDLVLLDVQMPRVSGLDVLERIRRTRSLAELPVILVTARSESSNVVEGLGLGANDYVTKPIDFPVALARIRTQLALKHAEAARRESEERYALAAAGARDGIWDWNLRTGKVYFSSRWTGMLGYADGEIASTLDSWMGRIHPEDRHRIQADLQAHIDGVHPHFESEHRILHKSGNYMWVLSRGLAVRDESNAAYRMAGSQSDITSAKMVDPLTGLSSRLLFMDRLARRVERARKNPGAKFAVLCIAVDRLNLVSDSLGHDILDQLLVAYAHRLQTIIQGDSLPERHIISRHSGGEFTVLLEELKDPGHAQVIANRILQMFEGSYHMGGHEIFVDVHVGMALGSGEERPDDLLCDADTAMYHAKALGKDRITVFDKEMRRTAFTRLRIETELRHAVRRKEFENWYQPIIELRSGMIHGLECLVRWQHPSHGVIGPQEFIAIAEENGLIVRIGKQVLEDVGKHLAAWQQNAEKAIPVSVNLSIRQLESGRLLTELGDMVNQSGIDPAHLKFEITESLIMRNPEQAKGVLQELRSFGAKVVMDDFGTGYSSLSYLKDFPLDELKIDRAFIAAMEGSGEAIEIVRTILVLAQNLGLRVTAEGVESEGQLNLLRQLGCDLAQGYFFSKPVDHRQTTDMLVANPQWPAPGFANSFPKPDGERGAA